MDLNKWYFRQRVTDAEMLQFNDFIEGADRNLVTDLLGSGLLLGGKIFENAPTDNTNILVNQRISYDTFGRRVAIQDLFGDKISTVVLGLTLQTDGIAVPTTVGTYILFTQQPSANPFDFVGEQIQVSRSKFPGNVGSFEVKQVVVTNWGGLIPNQIMVRIDEELDEDGYESGLAPKGTTSLARIDSTGQSIADVTKNELNNDVKPVNPGNERIVSLYARFDRLTFDTRLDGNAQLTDLISLETFKFVIDDSEPEDTIGNANTPALRTNGDVFLADVRLENGAVILQADIDTSRQTLITSLFAAASQIFELANAQVHGDQITWSGTNISVSADLKISVPNKSFLYTIPTFNQALADGEILYVLLDRTAVADPSPVHQVAARGSVPEGDEETLVLVIADRSGTKLRGALGGEMEPGETRDVGDSIGEAYQTVTGMNDENDVTMKHTEALLAPATNLPEADDILAQNITSNIGIANQDRNLKLVKGGVYGPPALSGVTADEVQRLLFSAIPDGGSITLSFNNVNTAVINAPFTATDIANALNALAALSTVVGSGAMPTADMTFSTADGAKDQPLIRVNANTLVIGAVPVTVAISVLTNGSADILNVPFSADAFIEVPGVELNRNTIQQSSISPIALPSDGSVAYVNINRTPGALQNLAVLIAHIEDIDVTSPNIFVLARRVGDIAFIGNNSFALPVGERLELDGFVAELQRYFAQLQIKEHPTNKKRVIITGADTTLLSGTRIRQSLNGLLTKFNGAELEFTTGLTFESDGSTPLGIDFTPLNIPNNEYGSYSISLVAFTQPGAGSISVQMLVLPPTITDVDKETAIDNGAPFGASNRIGHVIIKGNGALVTDIDDIIETEGVFLQQAIGGSGGGGEGNANVFEEDLKNRGAQNGFRFLGPNIFASNKQADDEIDSATANYSIADGVFAFQTGQEIKSKDMLSQAYKDLSVDLPEIELILRFNEGKVDAAPVAEVSRRGDSVDGYQNVTLTRISPTGDTYRGLLRFADELIKETLHERPVADADGLIVFDDGTVAEKIETEFVSSAGVEVNEKLTLYFNKLGAPVGTIFLKMIRDDAGDPSADPNDILFSLAVPVSVLGIAGGDSAVTVDISKVITDPSTKFHWVVETDADYKASYNAGVDQVALRADASAPSAPLSKTFNGATWNASANAIVFKAEGRIHDLRVRIEAGNNDVELVGFGVFFSKRPISQANNFKELEQFTFSGDANETEFDIGKFLIAPDVLKMYFINSGQVFRLGFFDVSGTKVRVPTNTFNVPGETEQ